jgi:hypothetical protein
MPVRAGGRGLLPPPTSILPPPSLLTPAPPSTPLPGEYILRTRVHTQSWPDLAGRPTRRLKCLVEFVHACRGPPGILASVCAQVDPGHSYSLAVRKARGQPTARRADRPGQSRSLPRTRAVSRAFGCVDVPHSIAVPCMCNRGCEEACQEGLVTMPPRGGSVFCPGAVSRAGSRAAWGLPRACLALARRSRTSCELLGVWTCPTQLLCRVCVRNRGCEEACQAGLFTMPPRGGSVFCPGPVSRAGSRATWGFA